MLTQVDLEELRRVIREELDRAERRAEIGAVEEEDEWWERTKALHDDPNFSTNLGRCYLCGWSHLGYCDEELGDNKDWTPPPWIPPQKREVEEDLFEPFGETLSGE